MKSFCIKTNDNKIKNYLLNNIACVDFDNIYYINRKFKIFENIIFHYTGKDELTFINILSSLLSKCIIYFYEPVLIKQCLNYNYFYFDDFEKSIIENNCYNYVSINEDKVFKNRKEKIKTCITKYILENKSMILDGFVNFRLGNYYNIIDEIVEFGVNKYIIGREYNEFIDLLKLYVKSKNTNSDIVHLIYTNGESLLLDENKCIIPLNDNDLNSKYLSDISFSSNDYALNTLLSLLPNRLEIHIIGLEDEFISTLKAIFDTRVYICKGCNICKTYKMLNNV